MTPDLAERVGFNPRDLRPPVFSPEHVGSEPSSQGELSGVRLGDRDPIGPSVIDDSMADSMANLDRPNSTGARFAALVRKHVPGSKRTGLTGPRGPESRRKRVERRPSLDPPYRQGPMRIDARMASSSARSAADVPGMCHVSMTSLSPLTSTM